jgi:hypothetical protein
LLVQYTEGVTVLAADATSDAAASNAIQAGGTLAVEMKPLGEELECWMQESFLFHFC